MRKRQNYFLFNNVKIVVCLILCVSLLSACEPLRKKFTRKKKKDREGTTEFIPVLDPIDYPARSESREEQYKFHYQLVKVWQKDFLTVLSEDGSVKRLDYLLAQIIERLQNMQEMLIPEKQKELNGIIVSFRKFKENVNSPVMTQSKFSMERKMRSLRRRIKDRFSVEQIKDSFR